MIRVEYLAVGNLIAVDFDRLDLRSLDLNQADAIRLLEDTGFKRIERDPIDIALKAPVQTYRRGAMSSKSPWEVDCSSFVKWVFGQCGIWLPRYSVQQICYGREVGMLDTLTPGDVVFSQGRQSYIDRSGRFVGHVQIVAGAAEDNRPRGDLPRRVSLRNDFLDTIDVSSGQVAKGSIRLKGCHSIRRFLEPKQVVFDTLHAHRCVECENDLHWILSQLI